MLFATDAGLFWTIEVGLLWIGVGLLWAETGLLRTESGLLRTDTGLLRTEPGLLCTDLELLRTEAGLLRPIDLGLLGAVDGGRLTVRMYSSMRPYNIAVAFSRCTIQSSEGTTARSKDWRYKLWAPYALILMHSSSWLLNSFLRKLSSVLLPRSFMCCSTRLERFVSLLFSLDLRVFLAFASKKRGNCLTGSVCISALRLGGLLPPSAMTIS